MLILAIGYEHGHESCTQISYHVEKSDNGLNIDNVDNILQYLLKNGMPFMFKVEQIFIIECDKLVAVHKREWYHMTTFID